MVNERDTEYGRLQCTRVLAVLLVALVGTAVLCIGDDTSQLRWDQKHISEYPVYKLLLKSGGYGSGVIEPMQWVTARQRKRDAILDDEKREPALKEVLKKYSTSEYADDAALLLARARLFYHNDAAGAIGDLYKVIAKYPRGAWIAEDRVFLKHAGLSNVTKKGRPRNGWYGAMPSRGNIDAMPKGKGRQEWEEVWKRMQEELVYFEYLEKHPNYTADEARYWIAWIIIQADLKDRMAEAEQVLRQVIEARRAELRTKSDNDAAGKVKYGEGITKYMDRTERKTHLFLIGLLLKQGKLDAAKATTSDYAKLHAGHDSVGVLVKRAT